MKALINTTKVFVRYLVILSQHQRRRFLQLFLISFAASLSESLGITMFFPLLDQGLNLQAGRIGSLSADIFAGSGLEPSIYSALLFISLFFLLKGFLKFVEVLVRGKLISNQGRNLRLEILHDYQLLRYDAFQKFPKGDLAGVLTTEPQQVQLATSHFLQFLVHLASATAFGLFSIAVNFWTTFFGIALGASVALFLKRYSFRISYHSRRNSQKMLMLNQSMLQTLTHYKYLKATAVFPFLLTRVKSDVADLESIQKELSRSEAIIHGATQPVSALVLVALIFWNHTVLQNPVTQSLVALLIIYKIMNTLNFAQSAWQQFSALRGHLDTLLDVHQRIRQDSEGELLPPPPPFTQIRLEKISLEKQGKALLKDVDFVSDAQGFIGICGRSGSGKTTFLESLVGLHEATTGKLFLDQEEYPLSTLRGLRRQSGFVTQDSPLFSTSLVGNISLYANALTELDATGLANFKKVIKQSEMKDFMAGLKGGADTALGDVGQAISGGQRQRLAWARELFRNPQFLFLDEATSALDSVTEANILATLGELRKTKLIFLVTHKPQLLREADQILVFSEGEIAERGSFEDLYRAKKSVFRTLLDKNLLGPAIPFQRVRPKSQNSLTLQIEIAGEPQSFGIHDISQSGLALHLEHVPEEFGVGTHHRVTITSESGELSFDLRIVHRTGFILGMAFVDLSAAQKDFLGQLVSRSAA